MGGKPPGYLLFLFHRGMAFHKPREELSDLLFVIHCYIYVR